MRLARPLAQPGPARVARWRGGREGARHLGIRLLWPGGAFAWCSVCKVQLVWPHWDKVKQLHRFYFLYVKFMTDKYVRLARSLAQPGSARVARRTCGREGAPHLGIRQLMTFQRGRWEGGFSDELLSSKDVNDEAPCVFYFVANIHADCLHTLSEARIQLARFAFRKRSQ